MDAVEVAEHDFGVVGAAEGDVELGYFVAGDGAGVGYCCCNGEHDVPEMRVPSRSTTSRDSRLCASVLGVRRQVGRGVHAVGGITRRGCQVCVVDEGVDESLERVEAGGEESLSGGPRLAEDGSRCTHACVGLVGCVAIGLDLDVGEGEGGVGETEAEFVDGCLVVAVECAVVDEDTWLC